MHLADFRAAYNFVRRLKTLDGFTPYEYVGKIRISDPDFFIPDAIHQMPGLNVWGRRDTGIHPALADRCFAVRHRR